MDIKKWFWEQKGRKIVNTLNEKGYTSYYADNTVEAKKLVENLLPIGASISVGGSVTLGDMGIYELVKNGNYNFFDRFNQKSWEDTVEIMRQSMICDYLITGTNAITKKGELVNTDSGGNRVAGMIFGPKKVIVVAGTNKIVNNLDEAFKRISNIAPMNSKRIGHKSPCTDNGECCDCNTDQRICNYTGIIHNGRKFPGRITVIIVGDSIGF